MRRKNTPSSHGKRFQNPPPEGGFAKPAGGLIFNSIMLMLALNFAYAATMGPSGRTKQHELGFKIQDANARKAVLMKEKAGLENRIRRLSDGYLDLELLDERSRDVLGYAAADDVIVTH